MIARSIDLNEIIPLRTSDTGEALSMMNDFYVRHLPIVNNKQLLGLLLGRYSKLMACAGFLQLNLWSEVYAHRKDHIYELLRLLAEYHLTLIPVVDDDGTTWALSLWSHCSSILHKRHLSQNRGYTRHLEMSKRIILWRRSCIVESENAAILSSFITTNLESTRLDITTRSTARTYSRSSLRSSVSTMKLRHPSTSPITWVPRSDTTL